MYDTLNLNMTLAKQRQEQLVKEARASRASPRSARSACCVP